jgi:DNA-binding CsgD family transcriptional regulator
MVAIVAYDRGDWPLSTRTIDVTHESPPGLAAALLEAIGLEMTVARAEPGALESLDRLRSWWERDGMIAVLSAAAGIDLAGHQGDISMAEAFHDDAVASISALWQHPNFDARIRLGALLLGHLASAAATGGTAQRRDLARRGDELSAATADVAASGPDAGRHRGLESLAWLARSTAEHLRLHWLSGTIEVPEQDLIAAWRTSVWRFDHFGHVYETARSRARLAAVLHATGSEVEARQEIELAREVAVRLGAEPLLFELRAIAVPGERTQPASTSRWHQPLTTRENEILALVAEGRSNREIGLQLYISAKTVSVHVSNILAKLGAAGRTEAVAVARRAGLLEDLPPG